MITKLLTDLIARHAKGETVSPHYVFGLIEIADVNDDDLRPLADWIVQAKIATKGEWNRALKRARRNANIADVLGAVPETALEFVELYAERMNAKIKFNGAMTLRGESANAASFARKARLCADNLDLDFATSIIDDAVAEFLEKTCKARRSAILDGLRHDPAVEFDWIALASAVTEEDPVFAAAMMQHFIWQTKRKGYGLRLDYHLMLIFGGPQKIGKSTFAKMLFSPVSELSAETDFAAITDDRNIDLWGNSVLFMDEMGYASKADAETVKKVITADDLTRRPMRTNFSVNIEQRATFIGSSNRPLEMLIRDTTGNRRFGYLVFRSDNDRAYINAVDWLAAWRSVDENAACPILPIMDQLEAHQAFARVLSPCEQWIADLTESAIANLHSIQQSQGGALRRSDLYEAYSAWQDDAGIIPRERLDQAGLIHELRRLEEFTDTPAFKWKKTPKFSGYTCILPEREIDHRIVSILGGR